MEVFLFIAVMSLIFWVFYVVNKTHQKTIRNGWKAATAHLNGRYNEGKWFKNRTISFKAEGHSAELGLHVVSNGKSSTTYTQITYKLPRPIRFRVHIYPEAFYHGLTKAFGSQDIEIGHASFDPHYMIKGSDPKLIRRFLTIQCRTAIRRARGGVSWTSSILIMTTGNTLLIRRMGYLKNRAPLINFADACNDIFACYLWAGTTKSPIQFFDKPIQAEGECPVCAAYMEPSSNVVGCSRCHTPHHKDCWRFFGSCAVYACGGTKFKHIKLQGAGR